MQAAAAFAAAAAASEFLRLLGCGVEGGARLAVGTFGVTRAVGAAAASAAGEAAFLDLGVAAVFADCFGDVFFVFFFAAVLLRDGAIAPLLGRARTSTGFLNSDPCRPADLMRADTGREGAVEGR